MNNLQPKIFFRADGNAKIGLGHVIRSLALADMLKDEFECHFMIRNPTNTLKEQILDICKNIIVLPECQNDIQEANYIAQTYLHGMEIIVLDGYHFITDYQQTIKNRGCKVVCIDDIHAYHFTADVVINHAPGLKTEVYSVEKYSKLCLGLDYALLRRPFLKAALKRRKIKGIKNIFICFGGSDFNNLTLKVLKAITNSHLAISQINVVLGGANIYKRDVEKFVKTTTNTKIKLHHNLSASEMCDLMDLNDIAIVPSSSILYEVIAVKMPVISGYYVDNQIDIYNGFESLNLIYGVDNFNTFSKYEEIINIVINENIEEVLTKQWYYLNGKSRNNFLNLFNKL